MNDLCADIGFKSINHAGEELCGDHVDVVSKDDGSTIIVLADGLGSGVQASILSTLTSKIISTMMAEDLSIEECVSTIAATLPVTGKHGVAYSTFTIINLVGGRHLCCHERRVPARKRRPNLQQRLEARGHRTVRGRHVPDGLYGKGALHDAGGRV